MKPSNNDALHACLICFAAFVPTSHAAIVDYTTATITTNPNNIVTTSSDGVVITAYGYHTEFSSSTKADVYGPFPTSRDARNSQYFGVETRLGVRDSIGLNAGAVDDITGLTELDSGTAVIEPGLDNNPRATGALPNIQFVLFTFSVPVDVTQVIADPVTSGASIWTASGSGAVPDLKTDFLGTLTALGVQTSISSGNTEFTHELTGHVNIDFLLVGTPPRDDPYGPLTTPDPANFYLDALNLAPTVIPVPASIWLFGSGLLGLISICRRKKAA